MKTFWKILATCAAVLTLGVTLGATSCARNSITDLRRRAAEHEEPDPEYSFDCAE